MDYSTAVQINTYITQLYALAMNKREKNRYEDEMCLRREILEMNLVRSLRQHVKRIHKRREPMDSETGKKKKEEEEDEKKEEEEEVLSNYSLFPTVIPSIKHPAVPYIRLGRTAEEKKKIPEEKVHQMENQIKEDVKKDERKGFYISRFL
uniref:Uncharacterized protein n=1 Tax=Caenorhabditis tropicalis TaxID=1561998 RepID=A0A1I7UFP4_9PELO